MNIESEVLIGLVKLSDCKDSYCEHFFNIARHALNQNLCYFLFHGSVA